jgi:hypothetical protein
MVLLIVYNTHNHWNSELCPSSTILQVLETGYMSIFSDSDPVSKMLWILDTNKVQKPSDFEYTSCCTSETQRAVPSLQFHTDYLNKRQ